uniref:Uncharacterized protein n=1 Tax=viral metagenome TaxID=1070528 RepID=A0A6M3JZ81_9ZZZZ
MATGSVETQGIVELNGVKYWLGGDGQVHPYLVSVFPEKSVTGDYTADSNPLASSWSMKDLTGGIGVMEMDETKDATRCWWAQATIDYPGHIRLPKLETALATPAGITLVTPTAASGWTDSNNVRDDNNGTFAQTALTAATWGAYLVVDQNAANCTGVRFYSITSNSAETTITVDVDVYYSAAWHNVFQGDIIRSSATVVWHTFTLGNVQSVTSARIRLKDTTGGTGSIYEADFINTSGSASGTPACFGNFDGKLWCGWGQVLTCLKSDGTVLVPVIDTGATIKKFIGVVDNAMALLLGTGTVYWYTQADSEGGEGQMVSPTSYSTVGDNGVVWDEKLFLLGNNANTFYYSTSPAKKTPSFTQAATLDLVESSGVQNLYVDQNSAGSLVIFAATKQGLWEYDFTNDRWLRTGLVVPFHANAGKGSCVWRDAAYFSAGLDVLSYQAGQTDVVQSIGLNNRDGLPVEYAGEIVKLIPGYNELYTLVDATQAPATATSFIAAYNSLGWTVTWVDSTTERTFTDGIVSTDFAYRLWFIINSVVTYLPLERGIRNPALLATFTYAAAGAVITPWFDGGWLTGNKRANQIRVGTAGVSANETIIIQYRINHATTALAATWTTLGTITSGTETVYTFGSSAGVMFKDIQFRFDLARGGTTTNSPEIRYVTLEYNKVIPKVWGWQMTLDCARVCDGKSSAQLLDTLVSATETETLLTFRYKSTTAQYVEIVDVKGVRLTGTEGNKGQYIIVLREVF